MDSKINKSINGYGLGLVKGYLYVVRFGCVLKLDSVNLRVVDITTSPALVLFGLLPRLIQRILRLNILNSCVSGSCLYFWSKRRYWVLDVASFEIISKGVFSKFKCPLNPLPLPESSSLLCGEYFSNPKLNNVKIYSWCKDSFELVDSFGAGVINHVHSVISINRPLSNCIVLCGDFEQASSIWILEKKFNSLKLNKFLYGEQVYRGSAGFVRGDELIYATDTTSNDNFIIHLSLVSGDIIKSVPLPASVIYGVSFDGVLYFSNNLEASIESKDLPFLKKWFSSTLPSCFSTATVSFYSYDGVMLKEYSNFECDGLPFRLFQYPTCKFVISGEFLIVNFFAINGYDGRCCFYKFQDLC